MIITMVVIKKITYCMGMFATKTITKFLKSKFKRQFLLLFQDDKEECKSLISTFPLKNKRFFIILPTRFISLNCTASQKFPN